MIEYWSTILYEAGLDADSINQAVCDRSQWREMVQRRKRYLEEWEGEQAKKLHGNQHSQIKHHMLIVCQWSGCGKVLKSIPGQKSQEKIQRANSQQETLCE